MDFLLDGFVLKRDPNSSQTDFNEQAITSIECLSEMARDCSVVAAMLIENSAVKSESSINLVYTASLLSSLSQQMSSLLEDDIVQLSRKNKLTAVS